MKDAQKPDHVSLNTLIGRLREGRFVILTRKEGEAAILWFEQVLART